MALIVKMLGANALSPELKRATKDMGGLSKVTAAAGKAFLAFGAVAAAAIVGVGLKLSIDLEKGLREVGTLMGGLSKGEMKDMADEMKNVSVQSGQALDKLVKAKYDIVSAGFADAAASAELLRVSADLAVGGVTEISTAADLLTTTVNAYSLSAQDAADVSDKLFTIVRLGKTTVSELGGSLGRVVAIAGQAGVSLDEVGAAVATLTSQGLDTARAITSLQGAIVQIIKPTEIMKGIIEDLGFATGEGLLQSEGFAGSLELIQAQAKKAGIPLSEVFGSIEALQAVLPLTGTAAGIFARNLDAMGDSAGAAAAAVEEMEKSASFQLGRMKQAFATLTIGITEGFTPAIAVAAKAVADLFQQGSRFQDIFDLADTPEKLAAMQEALTIIAARAEFTKGSIAEWANAFEAEKLREEITKTGQALDVAILKSFEDIGTEVSEIEEILHDINTDELLTFDKLGEQVLDNTALTGEEFENILDNISSITQKEAQLADIGSDLAANLFLAAAHGRDLGDVIKDTLIDLAAAVIKAIALKIILKAIGAESGGGGKAVSVSLFAFNFEHGGMVPRFEHGGSVSRPQYLQGGGFTRGTDTVPAVLSPGEIVSTAQAGSLFGGEIARLNQIATGASGGQGGDINITIQAMDGASVRRVLIDNPRELAEALRSATDSRNLTMGDLPRG